MDYQVQDWSNVLYFTKESMLTKRHRIALGVEYRHDPTSRKYVNQIYWRLGANYATSYTTNQYDQSQLSVSVGLGFPLRSVGTVINTSFEYGKRGFEAGILTENYLRFVVSAAIAEHWFFKRKL